MDWTIWAGYIALVPVVGAFVFLRRRGVERALDRAADVAGLGVPPEIRPLLLRRTRAVQIATGAGAVAGMTVGAFLFSTPLGEPIRYSALQGSVVLGGGIGNALGGLIAARALPAAGQRVARARALQVADDISPVERRGALVAMLIVVVFCVLASAFGASGSRVTLDVSAAIAVAGWIGFELVARRVVGRPQPADSALIRFWVSAAEPGRYFRDRLWPDTVAYVPETVPR